MNNLIKLITILTMLVLATCNIVIAATPIDKSQNLAIPNAFGTSEGIFGTRYELHGNNLYITVDQKNDSYAVFKNEIKELHISDDILKKYPITTAGKIGITASGIILLDLYERNTLNLNNVNVKIFISNNDEKNKHLAYEFTTNKADLPTLTDKINLKTNTTPWFINKNIEERSNDMSQTLGVSFLLKKNNLIMLFDKNKITNIPTTLSDRWLPPGYQYKFQKYSHIYTAQVCQIISTSALKEVFNMVTPKLKQIRIKAYLRDRDIYGRSHLTYLFSYDFTNELNKKINWNYFKPANLDLVVLDYNGIGVHGIRNNTLPHQNHIEY